MKFANKPIILVERYKFMNLVNRFNKQPLQNLLISIIVISTIIKFSLIGSGFLSFPDELRYIKSGLALKNLSELEIVSSISAIFSTKGRPGDAILKTIPNAFQILSARIFDLNTYESNNSYPLFIFNYIIFCLILLVHYKFSKLVLQNSFLALISVVFFSSLTNSYLYIRHSLPYDASLLILYSVIFKTTTYTQNEILSFKMSFIIGIISFFGYLVYPGYFPLFIISLFLFFFNNLTIKNLSKKIYHSIYYILGSIFCLAVFEVFSRIGNGSFIMDSLSLSSTVIQGSFEESFTFIVKYLFEVEGLIGIFLIIWMAIFFVLALYILKKRSFKQHSIIILCGFSITILFLSYAGAGYFLHKVVFYGRLLHQYFPFVCIFSIFTINELFKNNQYNKIFLFSISILFIVNFCFQFNQYISFSYPRDIGWELNKTNNLNDIEYTCEYEDSWSVIPINDDEKNIKLKNDTYSSPKVILINGCYIYPANNISKYHPFIPKPNEVLVKSKPHFMNFKAYQYEGYGDNERSIMDKMQIQIKIFQR